METKVNYSPLSRLLHRIAFSHPNIQMAASDIERIVFKRTYEKTAASKPVFITSLPRAGTTLMLNALTKFPSFASHTYHDMPFIMAPMLWSSLTKTFQKPSHYRERAHGDGILIGYDSPEAFEEILWQTFWPQKYQPSKIALWNDDDINTDAQNFFNDHMKKIVSLRRPHRVLDGRYISKNNGNIARIGLIKNMFPDANILVLVRDPIEQAASMLRQHLNFLELHTSQPFVRRYMSDIGHYEFGENHRPFMFNNLVTYTSQWSPLTLNYWVGYWVAAFEHVLQYKKSVTIISFEGICLDSETILKQLCVNFEIQDVHMLNEASALFNPPPPARANRSNIDLTLLNRSMELYEELLAH